MLTWQSNFPVIGQTSRIIRFGKTVTPVVAFSSSSHIHQRSLRYAVLGAGFAGLSVAWHLLERSATDLSVCVDVLDEIGIGGGASGVAGGLLHPYSPKVKPLWMAAKCWEETLRLLSIAETQNGALNQNSNVFIARRKGILRPVVSLKNMSVMNDNAQNSLASCRIRSINEDAAQSLVPNISVPLDLAFYMPDAVNIHPQGYLEALYLACETLAKEMSSVGPGEKAINFHKRSIGHLLELEGEYDVVIVCLGARSTFLPELSGKLPLRTCRGIIAHLHLPDNTSEEFLEHSPSILSDAWIAIQNPRNLYAGSTWEWKSRNYSQNVSTEEASKALEELIPKASVVYPNISKWAFNGARAGLRAMPPLTSNGSLPLLGQLDDLIGQTHKSKFWLFSGLGSRGLLYHAWLGKLTAQAVISCDEDVIPFELTSWRPKLIKKS
ncbi:putative FAD dependent oxidoreductase, FAD/NAD(P)-binding domain superfamily [Helianthus anomalus]